MSFFKQTEVVDVCGKRSMTNHVGALLTSDEVKLIGSPFTSSLNAVNWSNTSANGGSYAMAGQLTLTTGTNPLGGGMTINTNAVARFVGVPNRFMGVVRIPDAGVTGNTRRWGMFNSTNGVFFQMEDTELSIQKRRSSSDTGVSSMDWNGSDFTMDTHVHRWEIIMLEECTHFLIDGVLVHTEEMEDAPIANTYHLPITISNVNDAGITTSVDMEARSLAVWRMSTAPTRGNFLNINSTTSSPVTIKSGPGVLRTVVLNIFGSTAGGRMVLYDGTGGTGTKIATIMVGDNTKTLSSFTANYDIDFTTGLSATLTNFDAADVTVTYE